MSEPNIILEEEIENENPILIEGFPGVGLIANIVTQHIVEEKEYKRIGTIDWEDFPPIAMIYDGVVNLPVRIYNKKQFLVITSDIPIPINYSNKFAKRIVEWAEQLGVKKIISIGGISTINEDKQRVFSAAYNEEEINKLEEDTTIFSAGNISGVTGSILTQSKLKNLPAITLLGETQRNAPDPRAAASIIKVLNKKFNTEVETDKLYEQAEKIEDEMKKLAERMKKIRGENLEETALSPMYR